MWLTQARLKHIYLNSVRRSSQERWLMFITMEAAFHSHCSTWHKEMPHRSRVPSYCNKCNWRWADNLTHYPQKYLVVERSDFTCFPLHKVMVLTKNTRQALFSQLRYKITTFFFFFKPNITCKLYQQMLFEVPTAFLVILWGQILPQAAERSAVLIWESQPFHLKHKHSKLPI